MTDEWNPFDVPRIMNEAEWTAGVEQLADEMFRVATADFQRPLISTNILRLAVALLAHCMAETYKAAPSDELCDEIRVYLVHAIEQLHGYAMHERYVGD